MFSNIIPKGNFSQSCPKWLEIVSFTPKRFSVEFTDYGATHTPHQRQKRTLLILVEGGLSLFLYTRGTHQLRRFQNNLNRFGSSLSFGARAFSSLPSASSASSPTLPPSSPFSLRRWISNDLFLTFPPSSFFSLRRCPLLLEMIKGDYRGFLMKNFNYSSIIIFLSIANAKHVHYQFCHSLTATWPPETTWAPKATWPP